MALEFPSVQLNNGRILDGKKIGELTKIIINKFSEENLSPAEGKEVLSKVKDVLDEYAVIQPVID